MIDEKLLIDVSIVSVEFLTLSFSCVKIPICSTKKSNDSLISKNDWCASFALATVSSICAAVSFIFWCAVWVELVTSFKFSETCVVVFDVISANFFTSSATTANPRPCSPARAASIAAFNASKFV